mmetsp:Transcript_9305/g.42364  ORF Transcript_9305/g.42364 Transcript_9305/m.42364 type:complete len:237 (-) Transcript_9305:3476-4186(-)
MRRVHSAADGARVRRGWTGAIQPLRRRRPRVRAGQRADRAQLCGVPGTSRAQRGERRGWVAVPPRVLRGMRQDFAAAAARVRVSMPLMRAAAAAPQRVRDGSRGRHEERRDALRVRVRRKRGCPGEVPGMDRHRPVRVLPGGVHGVEARGVGGLLGRDGRGGGGPRGFSPRDGVRRSLHSQGSASKVRDGPGGFHEGGDHPPKVLTGAKPRDGRAESDRIRVGAARRACEDRVMIM